jgi:serine/threonine-protein kinase RsbW
VRERRLTVPAEAERLPALREFLHAFWQEHGLPEGEAYPFELALEELFVNVVAHGGSGRSVTVCLLHAAGVVTFGIEDDGPAFDPTQLPPPAVEARLEERGIGGQGVHLVRRLMDRVEYRRHAGRNALTASKQVLR